MDRKRDSEQMTTESTDGQHPGSDITDKSEKGKAPVPLRQRDTYTSSNECHLVFSTYFGNRMISH